MPVRTNPTLCPLPAPPPPPSLPSGAASSTGRLPEAPHLHLNLHPKLSSQIPTLTPLKPDERNWFHTSWVCFLLIWSQPRLPLSGLSHIFPAIVSEICPETQSCCRVSFSFILKTQTEKKTLCIRLRSVRYNRGTRDTKEEEEEDSRNHGHPEILVKRKLEVDLCPIPV